MNIILQLDEEVILMAGEYPSGTSSYVVKPGDTFFKLAQHYNTSVEKILASNPGVDSNNLQIGQTICLPSNDDPSPYENAAAYAGVIAARIKGGPLRPQINGTVQFQNIHNGTWVCVEVNGLPPYQPADGSQSPVGPHGFHIHESGNCEVGDPQNPFQAAGGHWNPANQPHGNHAGDFPVIFSNNGYSKMCFFTGAFKPDQVVGKSVVIHQNPDDYRTQPAGNSGKRLACGVIEKA
jgi:Cu-Zn family superoxide dismutase